MPPPAAPVISVDAVSAMSIRLTWETAVVAPEFVRFERCTGAGCTSWAAASPSFAGSHGNEGYNVATRTYAQRVTPGQTYRYRAYVDDPIDGDSGFSNILEVTIPTGTTGLTQVAGAVGTRSSYAEFVSNAARDIIAIIAGSNIEILSLQGQGSGGPAPCPPELIHTLYSDAMGNAISGPTITDGPQSQYLSGTDVIHCNLDQRVELRFRLGSSDYITKQHLSDGYYEVRVNGDVKLRVEGLPLGVNGFAGYERLRVSPFSSYDDAGTYGPMTEFYSNSTDVYGAGFGGPDARWNRHEIYAQLTDADMWTDIDPENPWSRYNDLGAPSTTLPRIENGGLLGAISYMEMEAEDTEPDEPDDPDDPEPGNGDECPTKRPCDPPPDDREPDDPPPSDGGEFLCAGGGDVPFYPTAVQPSMAGVREPRTWVRIDFQRDEGVA